MEEFKFLMNRVQKTYPSHGAAFRVLGDINLSIHAHEFVCIMGPTGCGKSTLMRLMCGIEPCDPGSYFQFYNVDAAQHIPRRLLRMMGVVFQSDNLMEWRTVYENVRLPLEAFGLRRSQAFQHSVEDALELVGLLEYKDCYPRELSGGMRQRVGIARGLVHNPAVLLLDQPFGALDAITRKTLNQELLRIYTEKQNTMVMVTNNINEALTLATRVIILSPKPSMVVGNYTVPFSLEERREGLLENPRFLELRALITALIHSI